MMNDKSLSKVNYLLSQDKNLAFQNFENLWKNFSGDGKNIDEDLLKELIENIFDEFGVIFDSYDELKKYIDKEDEDMQQIIEKISSNDIENVNRSTKDKVTKSLFISKYLFPILLTIKDKLEA